jgi:hypothetical protein
MFAFGITLCYFVMAGFDYDEWEEFCCEFDERQIPTAHSRTLKIVSSVT